MPTSTTTHHRSTSSTALNKKRLSGSARPILLRKNTSSKNLTRKRDSGDHSKQNDDDDITTFPQYCATCDTQLAAPSFSVLYCSEECRRSDTGLTSPASPLYINTSSDTYRKPTPNLIPPMSPTPAQRPFQFRERQNSQESSASSDTSRSGSRTRRPGVKREDSEAALYLRQFRKDPKDDTPRQPTSRPGTAAPSLSFSPSSCASSLPFSPSAKISRSVGTPYHVSTKSIELVTPTAACPTAPASLTEKSEKGTNVSNQSTKNKPHYYDLDEDEDEDTLEISKYQYLNGGAKGTASGSLNHLLSGGRKKAEDGE